MKMNPRTAALMAGFLASGIAAAATQTTTINVSASVPGACSISATALAFGAINGPNAGSASGDVTVNCSSGISYMVGMNAGQNFNVGSQTRAMINLAGDLINYSLTRQGGAAWGDTGISTGPTLNASAVGGTGTGLDQTIGYSANTTSSGGTVLTPGTSYADVVTVTVEF